MPDLTYYPASSRELGAYLALPRGGGPWPAGHSFLNRFGSGSALGTLLFVAGFRYHHPSAEDAWRRILAFFGEHLRDASVPADR